MVDQWEDKAGTQAEKEGTAEQDILAGMDKAVHCRVEPGKAEVEWEVGMGRVVLDTVDCCTWEQVGNIRQ